MKDFTRQRAMRRVAAVAACALLATACGNGNGNGDVGDDAEEGDNGEAAAEDSVSWSLPHVFPAGSAINESAEEFAERVADVTDGAVEINVFPDGQLGGDQEIAEGLLRGSVEAAWVNHPVAGIDDRLQLGFMPYIVENYEEADEIFFGDGFIAEHDRDILEENGVVAVGYFENDFRGLTNSEQPIESPDDLSGISIRIPELPAYIELFEAWGAAPQAIPFPELYTALQQGTVDAQDNGIILTFDSNFQEVQDYLTLTNHAYGIGAMAVAEDSWNEISEEHQDAIMEVAAEVSESQRELNRADVDEKVQQLEDEGMEITELTDDQIQEFSDLAADVLENQADAFGQDVIDGLQAEVDQIRNG